MLTLAGQMLSRHMTNGVGKPFKRQQMIRGLRLANVNASAKPTQNNVLLLHSWKTLVADESATNR